MMLDYFTLNFQVFMMMYLRILGLFYTAPILSSDSVKIPTRTMLAFMLTLIIFPVTADFMPLVPGNMIHLGLYFIMELFIGILIGFILSFIFAAFQMAGEFFNVQLGFGYTEVLDPVSQTSLPVISTLKNLMAMLLFLVTGSHRVMIESLVYSFEKIRFYNMTEQHHTGIFRIMEKMIGSMFIVAFKIALPVLGILFLVTVAEALMGKAAPQLNILQLSFPIKILIGLIVLIAIIPFVEKQMVHGFELSFDRVDLLIREWPQKL